MLSYVSPMLDNLTKWRCWSDALHSHYWLYHSSNITWKLQIINSKEHPIFEVYRLWCWGL